MSSDEQKTCSMPDCNNTPRIGQRYCPWCHSKYMRAWRAKRKREEEALKASIVLLRKRVLELEANAKANKA